MPSTTDRIKRVLVERLELAATPGDIKDDALLFAPASEGGLELDSLAALEIVVGLSEEFDLSLDEVPREAFMSVSSLADYVDSAKVELGSPA